MDPQEALYLYTGPCTNQYYNKFFNPNLCHVCKRSKATTGGNSELLPCENCRMIFYCSEEHRSQHCIDHYDICLSICENLSKECNQVPYRVDLFVWISAKRKLMELVRSSLKRKLQPDEEQMLMCRKSCFICHRRDGLQHCTKCYGSCYCDEHAAVFRQLHHDANCKELLLMLNLDIVTMEPSATISNRVIAPNFPDPAIPCFDTVSFILGYVPCERKTWGMHKLWTNSDFIFSDYISGPLTLYYGIQMANLMHLLVKSNFIVHVIAANAVDRDGLSAWELLLHLSHNIKRITVILIGPELSFTCVQHGICKACNARGQVFYYECHSLPYHKYMSCQLHHRPDVIIGFQANLNATLDNRATWDESLLALKTQNCPLFLTMRDADKAREDSHRIQDILSTAVKPIFSIENIFRAFRPYRNFDTDFVFYRNVWLIYYKNLHDPGEQKDKKEGNGMLEKLRNVKSRL
ncbi:PREDICTED: uncharacterized protein LOC106747642 [Dinoponera quadriceps]|uniref:Uncharacterized protein LOC106747642 n=1 Tax=Dinoponera quadriceps TaxID=609295 RepID=A0A6P3XR46_DINQU|nr:PREDICTED: uncharacterized protein LOC106747642 [Dinoponera quadriceps]